MSGSPASCTVARSSTSIGPRRLAPMIVVPDDQVAPLAAFDIVGAMSFGTQMHHNAAHLVAVAECQFPVPRSARVPARRSIQPRWVAIETHVKCDVAVVGMHIQTPSSSDLYPRSINEWCVEAALDWRGNRSPSRARAADLLL